jgi:hypothetical protein
VQLPGDLQRLQAHRRAYSEAEKTALFSKTAADFYRLGLG